MGGAGGLLLVVSAASVWVAVVWTRSHGRRADSAVAPPARDAPVSPKGTPTPPRDSPAPPAVPPPVPPPLILPGGDGPDWTPREMLEYLRSHGLDVYTAPGRTGQCYTLDGRSADSTYAGMAAEMYDRDGIVPDGAVMCFDCGTAAAAKRGDARYEASPRRFVWGRYRFVGDPDAIDRFWEALVGRAAANAGKIEGKWKIVSGPGFGAKELKAMEELKIYAYVEFKPDGTVTAGATSADPGVRKKLEGGPDARTVSCKYRLLAGDAVEFFDLPKELRERGVFGRTTRTSIRITGDDMTATDESGTAKLVRVK